MVYFGFTNTTVQDIANHRAIARRNPLKLQDLARSVTSLSIHVQNHVPIKMTSRFHCWYAIKPRHTHRCVYIYNYICIYYSSKCHRNIEMAHRNTIKLPLWKIPFFRQNTIETPWNSASSKKSPMERSVKNQAEVTKTSDTTRPRDTGPPWEVS